MSLALTGIKLLQENKRWPKLMILWKTTVEKGEGSICVLLFKTLTVSCLLREIK